MDFKIHESNEKFLQPCVDKWVIFPIEEFDIWEMYKKHVASFWTTEELDLSEDYVDWLKLDDSEKHFLLTVLCFFAASDGIVNENVVMNLYTRIQLAEARAFYSFQIAMEQIHSETYSLLIDSYIKDETQKQMAFKAIETCSVVKEKAEWSIKWMTDSSSFYEKLIAFACVEGIFFSGSFCAIFWLKKRGLMKGLTFSNELISRDEGLHTDFACLLYRKMNFQLPYERIHEIVLEAVNIEKNFICYALPCSLIGINSQMMSTYIEFVADRLLSQLNVPVIYNSNNPFDWMELISMQGKTNFFERRVGEYQKSGVMSYLQGQSQSFSTSEEF